MNLLPHCNNSQKPVVLLGSSASIGKIKDLCSLHKISIAGIVDHDYYGNTAEISGIPVIGSEKMFSNDQVVENYKNQYNFFCASTWMPEKSNVHVRNSNKRLMLLDLIDHCELPAISLIDPLARVASTAVIGKGVFVDAFVLIEPYAEIHDFANIYAYSGIGHHTVINRNCTIQRHCSIAGNCIFEYNTFVGTAAKVLKTGVTFGANTFIHECIYIRRGTVPNEVISLHSKNMSRVYCADSQVL